MLEDLKKLSYKGGYEYPDNVTGAYEVLIKISRQIGM